LSAIYKINALLLFIAGTQANMMSLSMKCEYIPNMITVLRLILIPPIIIYLLLAEYRVAFFLFFIASLTDAIDGYLARKYHWVTRWGSIVDPLADKTLMILTFLTLGYLGVIPLVLLIVVILRDVIIVGGGVAYHFLIGSYEFKPTLISKCNTFLQILLIILLMFEQAFRVLPLGFIHLLMILVFFTNIMSLLDYVIVWGMKAWHHTHHQ
jgi:cardiolipin synthase (CMP-forming)